MGNKIIFQCIAYFYLMVGKRIQLHTQIKPLDAFHKSYIRGAMLIGKQTTSIHCTLPG